MLPTLDLEPLPPQGRPPSSSARPARRGALFLIATALVLVGFLAWPMLEARGNATGAERKAASLRRRLVAAISTVTPSPTPGVAPQGSLPNDPLVQTPLGQGTIFLSLGEGGYHHLFAYRPLDLPLTRLTDGPWDDLTPALSPDRSRLAFASNRAGHWDLYLMELASGTVTRLTDTPQYEASPSWSPDGFYLAYETYAGSLEIGVLSLSGSKAPILLTEDPAADFQPAWSPQGRQVAFVSTRSGDHEIWLADLDRPPGERFANLSQAPLSQERHPAWSPQGSRLAWASIEGGNHGLYAWEPGGETRLIGSGDWPVWSPDGNALLTIVLQAGRASLAAYEFRDGSLALPPVALPGPVEGLAWGADALAGPLPAPLAEAARLTPTPPWKPEQSVLADVPNGRHHLVPLADLQAPYPYLHDLVDEAFRALRARLAAEAGWDLLASLENAFVPLTAPLAPGLGESWLYTGRAFAFTPLPANAGWMAVVPEAFGASTYWRVYLRARFQDGSQGAPLHELPWDFNARYGGDARSYEQGGAPAASIPEGYWVDFTELANAYGWERLPALPNWRSAYPAARFNEFLLSGGQTWRSAMLELYPPEALVTPTAILPPTLTPTPTSLWHRTATPGLTPVPPAGQTPPGSAP